ncbi:MAG: L-serine ammonia-lyase [Janthinobacterium lividum]
MTVSVFDLFKIGIGPSSSHTVGPMRAAQRFVASLAAQGLLERCARVRVELYGSLGATGKGHGTDRGVMLGLLGEAPETVDPTQIEARLSAVRDSGQLALLGRYPIAFAAKTDIVFYRQALREHPNALKLIARDADAQPLFEATYLSIGGGFIRLSADSAANGGEAGAARGGVVNDAPPPPYPFTSGDELLAVCREHGLSIAAVVRGNERCVRDDAAIDAGLMAIWRVMQACVKRGCGLDNPAAEGKLPGPLGVKRRAAELSRALIERDRQSPPDPLAAVDWLNVFAMAVNEENAAGGRVVTAPTNGAAGVLPAVLHYYERFVPGASDEAIRDFLLTAAAIGMLYQLNASISGAEVGCQGEVGVACSMAAAGLAAVMGGTPEQVENAAEIGMEHNLGLTCDPVGGMVQIPCIERNAMGAVKAVNAARMALRGNGFHVVSLDSVIKTMRETGADMKTKYKETSRGGLAVNIVEC